MSFFADIRGDEESKLKTNASNSLDRALSMLNSTVTNGFTPYYTGKSHIKSFAHPLYPIAQLARNALRLMYSAGVCMAAFGYALYMRDSHSATIALSNMCKIILASVIEILNAVCAIISLITRSIASAFNLGYTSTQPVIASTRYPESAEECYSKDDAHTEAEIHEIACALV